MARPGRQGVDYFPLDVHLDNKIKFLVIKFGLEGLGAIVTIFQEIYANGYWCNWGEDEKLIFTHENNIDIDTLDDIVCEALSRDIFDEEIFNKYKVLTSAGVQKRYQKIVERRKDVEITSKYLLIDNNFGTNKHIVIDKCIHDVDIVSASCEYEDSNSRQSKVKDSRVKESNKHSASTDTPCTLLKDIKQAEGEAYKINDELNKDESVRAFFEEVWSLYPDKRGKGKITNSEKKLNDIYKMGDEIKRCVERYIKDIKEERKRFPSKQFQMGSTFFNSGYVDYLDENVEEKKPLEPFVPKFVYKEL